MLLFNQPQLVAAIVTIVWITSGNNLTVSLYAQLNYDLVDVRAITGKKLMC